MRKSSTSTARAAATYPLTGSCETTQVSEARTDHTTAGARTLFCVPLLEFDITAVFRDSETYSKRIVSPTRKIVGSTPAVLVGG